MSIFRACLLVALGGLLVAVTPARAQVPPSEQQITAAVLAAPEGLREGATVLGYTEGGDLVPLREGTGELICLADDPSDERFHVACYHKDLEPFMVRGRELRAQQKSREEVEAIREEEARSGQLQMPEQSAALYSLTGPVDSFDPEAGTAEGATPLYVVYIPYATAESTGLPTSAPRGMPWIMAPGKPWAHIMIVPAQNTAEQ